MKSTTFDQLKFDLPRIPGIPWGPRFTCLTESRSWNFLFFLFIDLTFFIYYSIHVSYLKNKTLPLKCRGLRWIFVFVFHHVKIELSPSIRAWENHCDLVKMKSHQFLMRKSFFFFFCENDRKNERKYVERLTEPRRWQFSLTRMSMEDRKKEKQKKVTENKENRTNKKNFKRQ